MSELVEELEKRINEFAGELKIQETQLGKHVGVVDGKLSDLRKLYEIVGRDARYLVYGDSVGYIIGMDGE